MQLTLNGIKNKPDWERAGVRLPSYDAARLAAETAENPVWLHFGAGNIFRGYIAGIADTLINAGLINSGIIAAETFDTEIIDRIYTPHDNLVLNVTLKNDGGMDLAVYGSIGETIKTSGSGMTRLFNVAGSDSLQMVSYTITEKGYAVRETNGGLLPVVNGYILNPSAAASHIMSVTAAFLYMRYIKGGAPIALVSLDNCSENGDRLKEAVLTIARTWTQRSSEKDGFLEWLESGRVSFPWTMIDKITPSPSDKIADMLSGKNIEGMTGVITDKKTYIAPFVNAEEPGYLVIEDKFPNGRPPLEKAGVYMADRDTVKKAERMKVTACLNPLHSAMAPFGCLLGYSLISEQMKDADISALVRRIGYAEGLPAVTDPGIISPEAFLDEVINERLTNPFLPDSPRRIIVDHSQKVSVRFGETIKFYQNTGRDLSELTAIPLAIAGWLRYLLAADDNGNAFTPSADPLLPDLTAALSGIVWDNPESHTGQINAILKNPEIFGQDLTETPLCPKITEMFARMLEGKGAVRRALNKYIQK